MKEIVFSAYHNSHNLFYREPFGAVNCGRTVVLQLNTFSSLPVETCILRFWINNQELRITMQQVPVNKLDFSSQTESAGHIGLFRADYTLPQVPGLVWYYFEISIGEGIYYYGNNPEKMGGEGRVWLQEPPSYQITVFEPITIPEWYTRGNMYQVFVDRFCRHKSDKFSLYPRKNALLHANWSDSPIYIKDEAGRVTDWDFFGGTLQGIIEKITYFKELGISILYLNPIFDAVSNHKYDTADYLKIDPMYGTEEILKYLIETAKKNGMAIVLDGVFSHTGSDSIYFNKYGNYPEPGAYQSKDSPYAGWYSCQPGAPKYLCWWGVDSLPEVNEMDSSYRQFIYGGENSVIKKWLNLGIAGWRLDVADELPDQFIREFRRAQKSIAPQSILIGEVWEDASNKISYGQQRGYFLGNELDATMNYPLRSTLLRFVLGLDSAKDVQQKVMSLWENYPKEIFYAELNLLGSHDTARILTLLGDAPPEQTLTKTEQRNFRLSLAARKLAVQRLKLLSLVQMTFPGVPCIYYGDEAGAEGYTDPFNRGTYPWGAENQEILVWYKQVLKLRAEYEALISGGFKSFAVNQDVYGFIRSGKNEDIIVLINRHLEEEKTLNLTGFLQDLIQEQAYALVLDLLTGEKFDQDIFLSLPLKALGGRALFCQKTLPAQRLLRRSCGVLMHISSLPSSWGLGDLGREAYEFVDFLSEAGQSLWQVLPLNPPGAGGCPYQSESVFAGNTMFISLDYLIGEGLLNEDETRAKFAQVKDLSLRSSLQHQALEKLKQNLLREAYETFLMQLNEKSSSPFLCPENYAAFQRDHKFWLDDYCLFRALKAYFEEVPWYTWEPALALRCLDTLAEYSSLLQDEISFWRFLQYTFYYQWHQLKAYASTKGVYLIGDIPHFVAPDSCDVWANRRLFALDEDGRPAKTAGVPPDYFSKTGQTWGNPVYNWEALAEDQYAWWKKRLQFSRELFDYLRLDHFRGFEAYWEIEAGEETAEKGRWIKGPGKRFFENLGEEIENYPLIVEDLGSITREVKILKQIFGFPGMKVFQFTPLDEISAEQDSNFVYYTGTHDNNTLLGWYERKVQAEEHEHIDNLGEPRQKEEECQAIIKKIYQSSAGWVILQMQDILGLNEKARMNIPGTIHGNWLWQMAEKLNLTELKAWLYNLAVSSARVQLK